MCVDLTGSELGGEHQQAGAVGGGGAGQAGTAAPQYRSGIYKLYKIFVRKDCKDTCDMSGQSWEPRQQPGGNFPGTWLNLTNLQHFHPLRFARREAELADKFLTNFVEKLISNLNIEGAYQIFAITFQIELGMSDIYYWDG